MKPKLALNTPFSYLSFSICDYSQVPLLQADYILNVGLNI